MGPFTAARADVACQPPLPIPATIDADQHGSQPDRHALCNAAVAAAGGDRADASPGREEAARYAVRACGAVFCEGTCSGEDPPLTLYTALVKHDRKAGNYPSAFYFPPVAASASWVFAPETHFVKFGWIGGGGADAALSDKAGKAVEAVEQPAAGGEASEATEGEISFAVRYRRGEVRVEYLRTYEHIGKASVRVQDVSETDLCQHLERASKEGVAPLPGATPLPAPAANATTTEAVELDGWWPTRASYGDVASFKLPRWQSAEHGGVGCALVRVNNLRSQRTNSSKFKLLAIMSF